MVTRTHVDRSGPARAVGRLVFTSLAGLLMVGWWGAAEAYIVHLETDVSVCDGSEDPLSITVPLQPEQGNTLYLFAKTTSIREDADDENKKQDNKGTKPSGMEVQCPRSTVGTSRNHRGINNVDDQTLPGMVMYVSHLYHPAPGETRVTCTLRVSGYGENRGCLVFRAGASNTWLHASVRTGGWAWGTNLDTHNAEDNNAGSTCCIPDKNICGFRLDPKCFAVSSDYPVIRGDPVVRADPPPRTCHGHPVTIIGPGLAPCIDSYPTGETMDLGTREYVLKGRRFSADPSATSLDVYSDIQLTCESDEGSCDVTATLLVQRMKSPTSSTVCHTTTVSQTKTIDTYTGFP